MQSVLCENLRYQVIKRKYVLGRDSVPDEIVSQMTDCVLANIGKADIATREAVRERIMADLNSSPALGWLWVQGEKTVDGFAHLRAFNMDYQNKKYTILRAFAFRTNKHEKKSLMTIRMAVAVIWMKILHPFIYRNMIGAVSLSGLATFSIVKRYLGSDFHVTFSEEPSEERNLCQRIAELFFNKAVLRTKDGVTQIIISDIFATKKMRGGGSMTHNPDRSALQQRAQSSFYELNLRNNESALLFVKFRFFHLISASFRMLKDKILDIKSRES